MHALRIEPSILRVSSEVLRMQLGSIAQTLDNRAEREHSAAAAREKLAMEEKAALAETPIPTQGQSDIFGEALKTILV
eukprot:6274903-Amphidinium_carterae.3